MVVIGGYATFVSRIHLENHEDKPDWLDKINAGTAKLTKNAVRKAGFLGQIIYRSNRSVADLTLQ